MAPCASSAPWWALAFAQSLSETQGIFAALRGRVPAAHHGQLRVVERVDFAADVERDGAVVEILQAGGKARIGAGEQHVVRGLEPPLKGCGPVYGVAGRGATAQKVSSDRG